MVRLVEFYADMESGQMLSLGWLFLLDVVVVGGGGGRGADTQVLYNYEAKVGKWDTNMVRDLCTYVGEKRGEWTAFLHHILSRGLFMGFSKPRTFVP